MIILMKKKSIGVAVSKHRKLRFKNISIFERGLNGLSLINRGIVFSKKREERSLRGLKIRAEKDQAVCATRYFYLPLNTQVP